MSGFDANFSSFFWFAGLRTREAGVARFVSYLLFVLVEHLAVRRIMLQRVEHA
jgi:hypothetical protein